MRKKDHWCGVHAGQMYCRECGRDTADTLLGDVLHKWRQSAPWVLHEVHDLWGRCGFARSLDQILDGAHYEWQYTGDGSLPIDERDEWEIMQTGPAFDLFEYLGDLLYEVSTPIHEA